jgi:hypothetical protein
MPVSDEATDHRKPCGKWMPIAQDYCGRGAGHPAGRCRSRKAMESQRAQKRALDRPYDPVAARRWKAVHNVVRYGLTPEAFAQKLADQGYACAMCLQKFEDGQRVHVDHDHSLPCHPGEKQACDKCRRGLLCMRCNIAVGFIEKYGELTLAYLTRWRCPAA